MALICDSERLLEHIRCLPLPISIGYQLALIPDTQPSFFHNCFQQISWFDLSGALAVDAAGRGDTGSLDAEIQPLTLHRQPWESGTPLLPPQYPFP